ncbi:hypothetical protein WG908_09795 [Sphingobium sp. AN641]|uniref:hypothetical protein n=1 Tax=Sphingobium sp. AN641 TaxID=3133443 RepID=UPI0030C3E95C
MSKRLVEDCLALDLAWLLRLASIRAGQAGNGEIKWTLDGEALGSLCFRLDLRTAETARLILCYALATPDGRRTPMRQVITLAALPQHLGGQRWWLRCPVTGERARVLYLPQEGDRFASRKALGLAYRVERLNRFDRPFEKLFREQRKLHGVQGLGADLPRPKGMWIQTYTRRAQRVHALEVVCAQEIAALIGASEPRELLPQRGGSFLGSVLEPSQLSS